MPESCWCQEGSTETAPIRVQRFRCEVLFRSSWCARVRVGGGGSALSGLAWGCGFTDRVRSRLLENLCQALQ